MTPNTGVSRTEIVELHIGLPGDTNVEAQVREFTGELLAGTPAPMMQPTDAAVVADFPRAHGEPEAIQEWLRIRWDAEADHEKGLEDERGPACGTAVR